MSFIPKGATLFVVDLEYVVPVEQVEPLIEGHMRFLEECYDKGIFMASGPKVPRTGGVILAQSDSREAIEALITQDPFHEQGVARYTITEFVPRMTCAALAG